MKDVALALLVACCVWLPPLVAAVVEIPAPPSARSEPTVCIRGVRYFSRTLTPLYYDHGIFDRSMEPRLERCNDR